MTENWKPVLLAAKVIGHISQGMYRTPAGAIKELVSNAFDAGATYAKLHTGFPRFDLFSCEDNGEGISKAKFDDLMNGGIGDSEKHGDDHRFSINGRPIIGRLGVGLLSLAQICPRFRIVSYHKRSKTAFQAEIKFPPYSRQEVDKAIAEIKTGEKTRFISHGEYNLVDLEYKPNKTGITVTTSALRDSFRKLMSNLDSFANKQRRNSVSSYSSFGQYLQAIANPKLSALYFASQYDQLIFGIALAAPIPYVEESRKHDTPGTVLTKIPEIAAIQRRLKQFDFRVEFDNIELRRPVVLPSNKSETTAADCILPKSPESSEFELRDGGYREIVPIERYDIAVKGKPEQFKLYWFTYHRKVNGYPLKFSGYIFNQTTRLFPKEYQGVLIRIRNVAIGQYDVNVMTYPQAEGPRFSMLSGEVFVEEGLDDALKVDRDGFNTLDPAYIRLQAFVHSILHDLIFPGSWGEEKSRNKKLRDDREETGSIKFAGALKTATDGAVTSVQIVPKSQQRHSMVAVEVDRRTKSVKIYESNPAAKAILKRRRFRGVAARVVAAFEAANLERTAERRREVFYRLIGDIFDE
jgi:hypothetical protein